MKELKEFIKRNKFNNRKLSKILEKDESTFSSIINENQNRIQYFNTNDLKILCKLLQINILFTPEGVEITPRKAL